LVRQQFAKLQLASPLAIAAEDKLKAGCGSP
jgi:hypothetical protein